MPVGRRAWMLRSCATACSMTLRSSPACSRQTVVVGDQRRREIWREIWRRISRQAEAVAQSPIRGIGPRHTEAHRGTPRHTEAHRGTPRHTEAHRGIPRHTPQAAAEPRRGGGGPWGSARAQHAQSATPWGAWERLGHWGCCAHTAAAGPRRAATGPRRVVAGPGPGRGRARPGRAELGPRCAPAGVRRSAALLLAPRSAATSARLATGEG